MFFLSHLSSNVFLCRMIKILRQIKKFLVEFMNRLPHFKTHSIDRYDELTRVNESVFIFLVFFLEKTAFDLLVFCLLQRGLA